jgi:hypothetical protein
MAMQQLQSNVGARTGQSTDTTSSNKIFKDEGWKDDGRVGGGKEKVRMDLIPPEAIKGLAEVLTFGAAKYQDRNWEKGMKWGRLFAATQRHLWAWWELKDIDEESSLHHLKHALCDIAFLLTYSERGVGEDDRPHPISNRDASRALLSDSGTGSAIGRKREPLGI